MRKNRYAGGQSRAEVGAIASSVAAPHADGHGLSRRNTELFLLLLAAVPVILLYAMYVVTSNQQLGIQTLGVPLGLFGAFAAAHVAIRFLAPGADPAILPIVFALSGVGITFISQLENGKETTEMGRVIRVLTMLGIDLYAERRS